MKKRFEQICGKIREHCSTLTDRQDRIQIMEICGTHTVAIARNGLRSLFPDSLRLVSGPGCPVCVTDQSYVDQVVRLARMDNPPIIVTYGDMVRVPGRDGSLAEARAAGADVQVVYSAAQGLETARKNPDRQVVFLGVGFETTAPGTALVVKAAKSERLTNFSVLTSHKQILPAMRALLSMADIPLDGFLCPGHVSVIVGYGAYEEIVRDYARPCVVAGFDALQVLLGVEAILEQLVGGKPSACTVYSSVTREGNVEGRRVLDEVFVPVDEAWRALGVIPNSGFALREEFSRFDAARRFDLPEMESYELPGCRCGEVITGRCLPTECTLFSDRCTPRDPVGPCMVSSEGACAAAYKYERR